VDSPYDDHMTELPANDPHEVIHLGDQAAVVVPLGEYRQLRHDALRVQLIEEADAEEAAALAEYRAQQASGTVTTVPQAEVRCRFGLAVR
jgi:PHD/YefM family antitoxin component YafN of YafNO toxin-antitoxin module